MNPNDFMIRFSITLTAIALLAFALAVVATIPARRRIRRNEQLLARHGISRRMEMSVNCIRCGTNRRDGLDLLCKECRGPVGTAFVDLATGRQMRLVHEGQYAGWILYRHPDGQWVTLRKATDEDLARINKAVSEAHHR